MKDMLKLFKEVLGVEVPLRFQRMTWQEAMDRFGSDKPDTRFGMELGRCDRCRKKIASLLYLRVPLKMAVRPWYQRKGTGAMPRKKIDKLVDFAKDYGAKDWLILQSMKMEL